MVLPYLRPALAQFGGYTPNPGHGSATAPRSLDHLDTNECPYDLPPELKEKLAWVYCNELESNRYPDGSHATLKAELAAYVQEGAGSAVAIQPQHITVGNGSDELIRSLIIATCVGGAGSVAVADPTFSMYGIIAETLGVPVHRGRRSPHTFALDLDSLQVHLDRSLPPSQDLASVQDSAPPLRLLFVVHPNSPTANALTATELDWLRQVPEDVLVVVDEAYFEFSQQTVVAEAIQRPNWVVMRTFSKGFRLAGHRVGYGVANPDLIAALERVRLPYNLPSFAQRAAIVALQQRQALFQFLPELLQQRSILAEALEQFPAFRVFPSDANFLFLQLQSQLQSPAQASPDPSPDPAAILAQICAALGERGTLIRHTGGGLRITVGSPAENERTIDRLRATLEDLGLAQG
ncbi:MAG: histidinol-phosphate transaminase [Prochlorothrix sp.]|nr:histidinol-phosphate transaminase [Prochlorothrix sp.]